MEEERKEKKLLLFLAVAIGMLLIGIIVMVGFLLGQNRELRKKNEKLTQEYKEVLQKKKDLKEKEKGNFEGESTEKLPKFSTENQKEEIPIQEKKRIVAIDPGHQGWHVDMSAQEPIAPGASETKAKATSGTEGSYTGLPEYQLNLNVSLKLREELEKRGYEVILTREDNDTAISNAERAQMAAENGAEAFIRIHADGEDGGNSASGASALISTPENPYVGELYEMSSKLAENVLAAYCEATGLEKREIIEVDTMSGINWSQVPVIILEMGFMSHESDDRYMAEEENQVKMAEGIANGIDSYFEAEE